MKRRASYQKLRAILTKRRDMLRRVLQHDLKGLHTGTGIDIGDSADNAVDDEFNLLSSQLAQSESRELMQIEEALQNMKLGRYGICESCGQGIPLARLQALPYAKRCVSCQRHSETSERGEASRRDWSHLRDDDETPDDPYNSMFDRVIDVG